MEGVTNLSVKIGIGYGKCALLYVGGVFDRSEFFTVGSALVHALSSEEQATAGGQILVSESAFKHVKNIYYEGDEIINEEGKKFYRIKRVNEGVRGRADAVLLKA
jgi:class 3 adenylate cyclase